MQKWCEHGGIERDEPLRRLALLGDTARLLAPNLALLSGDALPGATSRISISVPATDNGHRLLHSLHEREGLYFMYLISPILTTTQVLGLSSQWHLSHPSQIHYIRTTRANSMDSYFQPMHNGMKDLSVNLWLPALGLADNPLTLYRLRRHSLWKSKQTSRRQASNIKLAASTTHRDWVVSATNFSEVKMPGPARRLCPSTANSGS